MTRFRVFARREDAERFIAEVRGDDPEIAAKLRIEERDLESAEVRSCRMGVTRPIDDAVEAFPAFATGVVLHPQDKPPIPEHPRVSRSLRVLERRTVVVGLDCERVVTR